MTFAQMNGIYMYIPIIIFCKGINMDTVNYMDRSTEFWSFGTHVTLDSRGRICSNSDVFFYLPLFQGLRDGPGSSLKVLICI